MRRYALISLYDTTGLIEDARRLLAHGFELLASNESSTLLEAAGIPVTDLAQFTGVSAAYPFPPTLHPKVEEHLTQRVDAPIDLVYINPYPPSVGNDVGGRTLLMLAVKGKRIAVANAHDLRKVLDQFDVRGAISADLQAALADQACFEIARHFGSLISPENRSVACHFAEQAFVLAEGENPYQTPAYAYRATNTDPLSLLAFEQQSGCAPCFTNTADADAILHTLCLLSTACHINLGKVPNLCIAAKHGNPCGVGLSFDSPDEAVKLALRGNPLAIWGGEMIVNFPVSRGIADLMYADPDREARFGQAHWMLDLIMAPSFSPEAITLLGKRASRKLLANAALEGICSPASNPQHRQIRGGVLMQPPGDYVLNIADAKIAGETLADLLIAWSVAYSSNCGGNEVALAKGRKLLSVGGGPSTVDATRTALRRCEDLSHATLGACFVADAFFPFTDAPALLAEAGVCAGIAPDGSRNDAAVKAFFSHHQIGVIYLPAVYRGFCRH